LETAGHFRQIPDSEQGGASQRSSLPQHVLPARGDDPLPLFAIKLLERSFVNFPLPHVGQQRRVFSEVIPSRNSETVPQFAHLYS
jgi:hypothetical protein